MADALRDLAAKTGPVWEKYRDGMTEYAARLWEGTVIGDTPPESWSTIPLFEVTAK